MASPEGHDRVEVTVSDAPQPDVGLGRARLGGSARQLLRLEIGDIVEVAGRRTTVARLFRSPPEDEGKEIIRIDGLVRANAGTSIGGTVTVRRAETLPAEEVVLAPTLTKGHTISFGQGIEEFMKRGLMNRPMRQGDSIVVPGIALTGGALPFIVIRTKPEGNVSIGDMTRFSVREVPFYPTEVLSPEEFLRVFVDRLVATLSWLMDDFGERVSTTPGEAGDRARAIRKKVLELIEELRGQGSSPKE